MQHVEIEAVDSRMGPADVKRRLGAALGAEEIAINYYELEQGETFGFGYHRHPNQEEVFVVLSGTVTFETTEGTVSVGADEAVRFAPGEWQLGRNTGQQRVRAIALGAPADAPETEMVRVCEECGTRTENRIEMGPQKESLRTFCEECGAKTGRFD